MPAVFDREGYVRMLRNTLLIMFVTILVYCVVASTFLAPHVRPRAILPAFEAGFVLLALALVGLGLWQWRAMPDARMRELPARKLGKAEREPGWPPRARAVRSKLYVITAILEGPAMLGVILRTMGAPLGVALAFIAFSAAGGGWVYFNIPAKMREVLG